MDDFEAMRKALALDLIQMKENMEPLYEAAEGTKADLTKRGWSPPVAEWIASEWLVMMMRKMSGL